MNIPGLTLTENIVLPPIETLLPQNPTTSTVQSSNINPISTISSTTTVNESPRTAIQIRPPGFQLLQRPSSTHRARLDPY